MKTFLEWVRLREFEEDNEESLKTQIRAAAASGDGAEANRLTQKLFTLLGIEPVRHGDDENQAGFYAMGRGGESIGLSSKPSMRTRQRQADWDLFRGKGFATRNPELENLRRQQQDDQQLRSSRRDGLKYPLGIPADPKPQPNV